MCVCVCVCVSLCCLWRGLGLLHLFEHHRVGFIALIKERVKRKLCCVVLCVREKERFHFEETHNKERKKERKNVNKR